MPYRLSWYQKNRIVLAVMTGVYTVEEMQARNQELIDQYLERGQAPIHLISDARDMRQFPTSMIKVQQINESWLRHPNLGWTVIVGNGNILLNFLAAAITKAMGVKHRTVATHEEAIETLKKMDTTLNQINV